MESYLADPLDFSGSRSTSDAVRAKAAKWRVWSA